MTVILSMHDYRKHRLAPVGYLEASARRSDGDGLDREHVARVMEARRAADRHSVVLHSQPATDSLLTVLLDRWSRVWPYLVVWACIVFASAVVAMYLTGVR